MAPPAEWAAGWVRTKALENPHTGTTQFYAAEPFEASLPAGPYRVRMPRPPYWGGLTLVAGSVELWVSRPGRIHDRAIWRRSDDSRIWLPTRLQP
jgi:hypothetical protein